MTMDISQAAQPRSDQLNADDLIGGPQLITIVEVRRGNTEQPIEIVTREFGAERVYKPGKSMIRVMISAWGKDASTYVGRRLMLFRDPDIRFGKDTVGGIRISAMSHISSRLTLALTVTRGRRAPFVVDPLPDLPDATTTKDMSDATRKKWIGRIVELLIEGDCASLDDQLIVIGLIIERVIDRLDGLSDNELTRAGNAIGNWSKAGTLTESITTALNSYVAAQSEDSGASVEGSDAPTGDAVTSDSDEVRR